MKKSLLALAALTAFAGAASAQSSVTIFGVVDLAGTYVDGSRTRVIAKDPITGLATKTDVVESQKLLMTTDGNASSRLGFRGVEDLGGGMRAAFWLEGALGADDGVNALNWQRRATVGLIGGFGEVRLGRDYTPVFWNWTQFDPFGTNGVGSATNLGLEVSTFSGGSYGTLVRANNTIGYHLPAMGGIYGQVMASAGEGVNGNKGYFGRLGYAAGPLNVAGSYGVTEFTPAVDFTNMNFAGSFDAGFAKFAAFYSMLDADQNLFEQTNWYVGASVPFGAFTLKATYGSVERDQGPSKGDASQIAVGFTYDLSKRTAVYGTYSTIDNSGTAFRVFGGTNAPSGAPNADSQGFQLGVRHSF